MSALRPVALLVVSGAYVATLLLLEERGFWAIDNANKFLQLQAVSESGYRDWALPWNGVEIDPQFDFNPMPAPFSRVEGERLFSFYPPFFAAASSVPWRIAGHAGLYWLPLAGALLALLAVDRAARTLGLSAAGRAGAVLLVGLATPLWFYSAVFWEHAPAVGLAAWGASFLLRFVATHATRDLVRASLCSTAAIYFRDELYLFCAALLAVALHFSPGRRLAVARTALLYMALGILPLWAFQWLALGHPLGFHVAVAAQASAGTHLLERPAVVYQLFVAFLPHVGVSLLLAAPFVAGFLLRPRLSPAGFERALPAAAAWAALCAGVTLAASLRAASPIEALLHSNTLFATAPLLLLGFVTVRNADAGPERALWLLGLVYAGLYTLATPLASTGGLHWGNRLLLILYPLLGLGAAASIDLWSRLPGRRSIVSVAVVALCCLAGFAVQLRGLQLLEQRKQFSWRLSQAILARPETTVVTSTWWVPQELHAAWPGKAIFLVESETELQRLLERLRADGQRELLYVTPPDPGSRGALVERLEDPLAFYSLDFLRVDL